VSLPGGDVDLEVTVDVHASGIGAARCGQGPPGAPQHGPHSSHQLLGRERLGHVVVGPQLQPDDAVALLAAGREDHDGYRGQRPQAPAHLEPVDARQHEIEDHEVGRLGQRPVERGAPVGEGLDHVAVVLEVAGDDLGDGGIVVDHQDPRRGLDHHVEATATACDQRLRVAKHAGGDGSLRGREHRADTGGRSCSPS
jgi:hypothetical protein